MPTDPPNGLFSGGSPTFFNFYPPEMLIEPQSGGFNNMTDLNNPSSATSFEHPFSPPRRTRRKELFAEPMQTDSQPSTSQPLQINDRQGQNLETGDAGGTITSSHKRKRESSSEPVDSWLGVFSTSMDDSNSEILPDKKGKGKETDRKGKGKQRDPNPQSSPIVIPDSPVAQSIKPPAKMTNLLTKPPSEPLSSYTCPICFSAPTNATLTPCGHICCGECLFTAVKTVMQRAQQAGAPDAQEARCPVCRALIPDWDGKGGGVIGLKARAIFSL